MLQIIAKTADRAALPRSAWCSAGSPALAQKKYDDGATDTEIKIGHTNPYSGPASAYGAIGKTIEAYWKMVNDDGGINGRKINFITLRRRLLAAQDGRDGPPAGRAGQGAAASSTRSARRPTRRSTST